MLSLVVIPVLVIHLLAANVAAAGPAVGAWLWRQGREAAESGAELRAWGVRVVRGSLFALAVVALLGSVLLVAPGERLRGALARFPESTYWFAGAEVAFSAVCLAGMLVAMRRVEQGAGSGEQGGKKKIWLVGLLGTASVTNLLYHFPPLMIVLGKLAAGSAKPLAARALLERRDLVRMSTQPEILAMWVHFVLASLAVAAVAAMRLGGREEESGVGGQEPEEGEGVRRVSARLAGFALVATVLQLPVGLWVYFTLPARMQGLLAGGDPFASVAFLTGLGGALMLLRALGAVAMGDADARPRRAAIVWLVVVATAMTIVLRSDRTIYFAGSSSALSRSPAGSLPAAMRSPNVGLASSSATLWSFATV